MRTRPHAPHTRARPAADSIPVSASCLDLLNRLLQPNPDKRLRIEAVIRHPWFLQDLPQEALTMNMSYLALERFPRSQSQEEIYKTVQVGWTGAARGAGEWPMPAHSPGAGAAALESPGRRGSSAW
jgi:serine/threonine protein kinase